MELDAWRPNGPEMSSLLRFLMILALSCMRVTKISWIWPPKKAALFSKYCSIFERNGCRRAVNLAENSILWHLGGFSFQFSDKKAIAPSVSKQSPHPSINQDLRCLTSVIRWEPLHLTWYGCCHWYLKKLCFVFDNTHSYNIASHNLQFSFLSSDVCFYFRWKEDVIRKLQVSLDYATVPHRKMHKLAAAQTWSTCLRKKCLKLNNLP